MNTNEQQAKEVKGMSILVSKIIAIGNGIASVHLLRARQLKALIPDIERLERKGALWQKAKLIYPDLMDQIAAREARLSNEQ